MTSIMAIPRTSTECRECPADELREQLTECVSGLALVVQELRHFAELARAQEARATKVAERLDEIAMAVAYMQGRMERSVPPPGRRLSRQIVIFGSGASAVIAALLAAARAIAG